MLLFSLQAQHQLQKAVALGVSQAASGAVLKGMLVIKLNIPYEIRLIALEFSRSFKGLKRGLL